MSQRDYEKEIKDKIVECNKVSDKVIYDLVSLHMYDDYVIKIGHLTYIYNGEALKGLNIDKLDSIILTKNFSNGGGLTLCGQSEGNERYGNYSLLFISRHIRKFVPDNLYCTFLKRYHTIWKPPSEIFSLNKKSNGQKFEEMEIEKSKIIEFEIENIKSDENLDSSVTSNKSTKKGGRSKIVIPDKKILQQEKGDIKSTNEMKAFINIIGIKVKKDKTEERNKLYEADIKNLYIELSKEGNCKNIIFSLEQKQILQLIRKTYAKYKKHTLLYPSELITLILAVKYGCSERTIIDRLSS